MYLCMPACMYVHVPMHLLPYDACTTGRGNPSGLSRGLPPLPQVHGLEGGRGGAPRRAPWPQRRRRRLRRRLVLLAEDWRAHCLSGRRSHGARTEMNSSPSVGQPRCPRPPPSTTAFAYPKCWPKWSGWGGMLGADLV